MGKYSITLVTTLLVLSVASAAFAHTTEDKNNNYGWDDQNKDGSYRSYDSPNCEKDQRSHLDAFGGGDSFRNGTARTCEGEHWHANSTFTGQNCELHQVNGANADTNGWCIGASPSQSFGGWNGGANGPVDVVSAGGRQNNGAQAMVALGIFWVGQTGAGVDYNASEEDPSLSAAWYGEDETDKSPLAPICAAFFQVDPGRTGPGVNNCLAYWFEVAGIVSGQIGDRETGAHDCSFDEYNSHTPQNHSKHCWRDHTSIGATIYLP